MTKNVTDVDRVHTQVAFDGLGVGAVAVRPVLRVRRAVAVGQEDGGEVGDVGAADEGDGAEDPPHLGHAPRQRQHAGPYDGRDGVRRRRPYRSCQSSGPLQNQCRIDGAACIACVVSTTVRLCRASCITFTRLGVHERYRVVPYMT